MDAFCGGADPALRRAPRQKICLPEVLGAVLAIGFSTKPIFAALPKFCGLFLAAGPLAILFLV